MQLIFSLILAVSSPAEHASQFGTFVVGETVDPMSDEVRTTAMMTEQGKSIAIGCSLDRKRVQVFFQSPRDIVPTNIFLSAITLRFDASPPSKSDWLFKGNTAYLSTRKEVSNFVMPLLKAKKLAVRWPTREGGFEDVTFNVEGAVDAMKRVAGGCSDQKFTQLTTAL